MANLASKRVVVALAGLALIVIVSCGFAAQLYQQKSLRFTFAQEPSGHFQFDSNTPNFNAPAVTQYCMLAFPATITVQTSTESQTVLANSTRSQIYNLVTGNPGISFRAVCAGLCIPVGLAEYHLGVLVRAGVVSFVRDGRYKRFFAAKRFSKREMRAICLLRHKTAKKILEALMFKRQLSHGRLADEVSISSQALTWQMKSLRNTEFVLQINEGLKLFTC
jgi:predicted transcriptional regulator